MRKSALMFFTHAFSGVAYGGATLAMVVMAAGVYSLEVLGVVCALCAPIGLLLNLGSLYRLGRVAIFPSILSLAATAWLLLAAVAAYEGQGPILRLAESFGYSFE